VGDEDHREAELHLQLLDLTHQGALCDDVERRRRLVHQHQLGGEEESHGDHGPLTHATAQLVRVAVQVSRVDTHQPEDLGGAVSNLLGRHLGVRADGVGKLRRNGLHGIERVHGTLHHHGVVAPSHVPQLGLAQPDHVLTGELHAAPNDDGRRREELGYGKEHRRLAATRLPNHTEKLSRRHTQRHVIERSYVRVLSLIVDGEVGYLKKRICHAASWPAAGPGFRSRRRHS
jgi:hypothetical protein